MNHEVYQERNRLLRELGFESYSDYLTSLTWQGIRASVMRRDEHRCQGCGGKAWQVHHKRYSLEALNGSDLSALAAVCGNCHKAMEFRYTTKTSLKRANVKLSKLHRKSTKHSLFTSDREYRELVIEKSRLIKERPQNIQRIKEVSAEIRFRLKREL